MKQDKIRISIDEILRILICIFHIAYLIEIMLIVFFYESILNWDNFNCLLLWICYKQKLNLRRTDAQGQPARASLKAHDYFSIFLKPPETSQLPLYWSVCHLHVAKKLSSSCKYGYQICTGTYRFLNISQLL